MSDSANKSVAPLNPIGALQAHPIYSVAENLTDYLGIRRDWITFAQLLSIVAGRMATPINLDIVSDQWSVDIQIADRLTAIIPGTVARIDTYAQFRDVEKKGFAGKYVLWARRDFPKMFHEFTGFTSRAPESLGSSPSLWRISPRCNAPIAPAATLRLISSASERFLENFAEAFSSRIRDRPGQDRIAEIINCLNTRVRYICPFRDQIIAGPFVGSTSVLSPTNMQIVERLLQIFTVIRRVLSDSRDTSHITVADYEAVRVFLKNLPLVPNDRIISAEAIFIAERIYATVNTGPYQLALPDRSSEGHKWFSRNQAVKWTDLAYSTIKKYFGELEDSGILTSTIARNNRERGRSIFYRFLEGLTPPFNLSNPFSALPSLA
ncbi:MAG: hypothetical protein ACKVT0_15095 [Planctomycetaceae bacterium]